MTVKFTFYCAATVLLLGLAVALPVQAASVPFLSQAPFGEWHDLRQGQGCEEAAVLMGVAWARGENLDKTNGRAAIIAISDWEKLNYGYFVDTSIQDTADRLFKIYLGYSKIEVQENITSDDILKALKSGDIAMVAINGQKTRIPYHQFPGPRHHMLLVIGYDQKNDAFITHDPGSRRGANLKIARWKLDRALQNYPSGDGSSRVALPPAMIVISK